MRSLVDDDEHATRTARHTAILTYAIKLTVTPAAMTEADLTEMRGCGLNDRDILDVNQATAYFAYVNRVADGLGVTTDAYAEESYAAIIQRRG